MITICKGNPVKLHVQGTANSYNWYPFTGLDVVSGPSVTATPPSNITYTVIGSVFNCTRAAVATVSVLPLPVATASFVKSKICVNEIATLVGEGGLSYTWLAPNGMSF